MTSRGRKSVVGIACVVGAVVMGTASVSAVTNSDFEDDTVDSAPSGWTVVDGQVDLGVTTIAGCRVVDTSTYGNLRDFAAYAFPDTEDLQDVDENDIPHPNVDIFEASALDGESTQLEVNGSLVWNLDDDVDFGANIWFAPLSATTEAEFTQLKDLPLSELQQIWQTFGLVPTERKDDDPVVFEDESVTVVDGSAIDDFEDDDTGNIYSFIRPGKVLELFSETDEGDSEDGYVAHGPAIYSDVFSSGPGRQLSFWWAASGDGDDYKAFAYLVNIDTCEQTEILDSQGLASEWQRARASVTAEGNYRFVFILGTYDHSWGGVAGAKMFIDDISEEVDEDPPAEKPERVKLPRVGGHPAPALLATLLVGLGIGIRMVRRRTI